MSELEQTEEERITIKISISELMNKCYRIRWGTERFIKLCASCEDRNICRRRIN